jgi:alkane 1-monooxygenase
LAEGGGEAPATADRSLVGDRRRRARRTILSRAADSCQIASDPAAEGRGMSAVRRLPSALPFWLSMSFVPLAAIAALHGGWAILLIPVHGWIVMSLLDAIGGLEQASADPAATDEALFWHRLVTLVWLPVQVALIFGALWAATRGGWLEPVEQVALMAAMGVAPCMIGFAYAHELVHQRNRLERALGDAMLATLLFGHFRTEHLHVHHVHVGTERDPATARAGESFWAYLPRTLAHGLVAAWRVERDRLARRGRPVWSRSNPFWIYAGGAAAVLTAAWAIGGAWGVALYLLMAATAILGFQLTNYVEHYGLTRRVVDGRAEPVRPHHAWNANHRFTNYLFINLQRHSDHHCRPDRRYPLLQAHGEEAAPQLPFGYPLAILVAMAPPLWRRVMDPRLEAWRRRFASAPDEAAA